MRIVIDMQGAQTESRFRGIGRYTTSFAQAVIRNRGEHEVVLALNGLFPDTIEPIRAAFDGILPQENIRVWHVPSPTCEMIAGNESRREVAELLREAFLADLAPDLIHVTSLFEGYVDDAVTSICRFDKSIPVTVSLYDLIPLLNPEHYLKSNPRYEEHYLRKIEYLRRSALCLAISEFSAQEGVQYLHVPESQVINISTAITPCFRPINIAIELAESLTNKFGINRRFILYTGGADERKNLRRLINAYAQLPEQLRKNHQLLLAGKMPEKNIADLKCHANAVGLSADELQFTGYVSDDELVYLYNLRELFVFPSWHEGFGLPALEAMACGAAVIGANAASLPEVIGRQDALFDPYDEVSISQLMARTLRDTNFRSELAAHGKQQATKFSWDKCAKRAIQSFENLYQKSVSRSHTDWATAATEQKVTHQKLIAAIAKILRASPALTDRDLIMTATSIADNEYQADHFIRSCVLPEKITWRIEGPFDSSYSLALLNRETALALNEQGHHVLLHSTEGPGDFAPNFDFLRSHQDIAKLHSRSLESSMIDADVCSRNLYPPRVDDMNCRTNLLHHYAWEESGFPQEWVETFNDHLQGLTCLSNHVEKIMIDHGVTVPTSVSGCGVDHWVRVTSDKKFEIDAKSFRFLHVSSCFPRKGADLLLEAYGRIFTSDDDVTLVIKTFTNPHNEIRRWLAEARAHRSNFPDVLIIEDDLTEVQLKSLYNQCHAMVAPSRAEGFGLPMAEAMLSGLAVVTTAWGGQLDFCNAETAWLVDYTFELAQTHFDMFDSVWAKPSVESLAMAMRAVHDEPASTRDARSAQGRQLLMTNFRWSDTANRLVNSARLWARTPCFTPQKIGWITTWNTRCGIATYSAHLLEHMPKDLTILAARTSQQTEVDGTGVVRCWDAGERDSLEELTNHINSKLINTVVIQFNYGFFNFDKFSYFLTTLLNTGKIVVLTLHSTTDPTHASHKKLGKLRTVLSRCHRILVHSLRDLNNMKSLGLVNNVTLFPHGVVDYTMSSYAPAVTFDYPTIASYGFFLPHKGLLELIEAVAILGAMGKKVHLHMINAEYPAPESTALIRKAVERVSELNVADRVQITTDFLSDDKSLEILSSSTLIIFPYQNTGESASGAVRYGLATGRPVAVTPLSIFDDVSSAVHILPGQTPSDIARGISQLLDEITTQTEAAKTKQAKAERWRKRHTYSILGQRLYGMLQALAQKSRPLSS